MYYSSPNNTLNGCIDDVVNIKNILIDAYGYQDANIIVFRDDMTVKNAFYPKKVSILSGSTFKFNYVFTRVSTIGTSVKIISPTIINNGFKKSISIGHHDQYVEFLSQYI